MVTRRSFLSASSLLLAPAIARADVIRADFPAHEPELVQEVVVVSHGNVARLKELVGRRPALAKVSFDWGFGDWETPIDAAVRTAVAAGPAVGRGGRDDLRGDPDPAGAEVHLRAGAGGHRQAARLGRDLEDRIASPRQSRHTIGQPSPPRRLAP